MFFLIMLTAVWATIRTAAPPEPPTVGVPVARHDLVAGQTLGSGDIRIAAWPADVAPAGRVAVAVLRGQTVAMSMSSGEAITRARLLGPGLLAGQPAGTVAITVRLADPASLAPVRPGDRVDVLAAAAESDAWTARSATSAGASAAPDATEDPSDVGGDPDTGTAAGGTAATGAARLATAVLVLAKPGGGSGADAGTDSGWAAGALGSATGTAGASGTTDASSPGVLVLAVDQQTAARLAGAASSRPFSVVLLGTG